MSRLVFFRQTRVDGGVRTGVDLDDVTILHHFKEPRGESDPVLVWYLDLRCEAATWPETPEGIREWLIDHAPIIQAGMTAMAEELRMGVDPESWPLRRRIHRSPRGVTMELFWSASRRVEGREAASLIMKTGSRWKAMIRKLEPFSTYAF